MTVARRTDSLHRAGGIRSRIQGEVLQLADACVLIADAAWPLDDLSAEIAQEFGGEGLITVPEVTDMVALLTQTCDLQETTPEARLCQVAPVVDRGETFAHQALRGRLPGWAALPWHEATTVADLSRITTVERSVLIGAPSLGRPATPEERLHFAETVSRHFTRVALPDPVSNVLRPVIERMKRKHDKDSPEGKCIALIANLRVEAFPDLDDPSPRLQLLVVLEADDLASIPPDAELDQDRIDRLVDGGADKAATQALGSDDPVLRREAWAALADLWILDAVALVDTIDGVDHLDVEVLSGDELSFTRLRNAPELDLAYLTTRAA